MARRLPPPHLVAALQHLDEAGALHFERFDPEQRRFLVGPPGAAPQQCRALTPAEVPAYLAGAADAVSAALTSGRQDPAAVRARLSAALTAYREAVDTTHTN